MVTRIEITVSLPKALFDQAESMAQQRTISRSALFERAVEHFIKTDPNPTFPDEIKPIAAEQPDPGKIVSSSYQDAQTTSQSGSGQREIKQGELYWLQVQEPGYPHPHVVIQDDAINGSRINTVVVCALTSNLKRATEPGNLLLEVGEANLTRQSVVVVSQVDMVDKTELGEYIGALSQQRIEQILAGMRFQQLAFFARYQAR